MWAVMSLLGSTREGRDRLHRRPDPPRSSVRSPDLERTRIGARHHATQRGGRAREVVFVSLLQRHHMRDQLIGGDVCPLEPSGFFVLLEILFVAV